MMRAIVLNGYGGLERLTIKELPDPEPRAGHVLITVIARIRCRTLLLQL
jgi:NADPH:quinone reductase